MIDDSWELDTTHHGTPIFASGCAYFFGFSSECKFDATLVSNERIHPNNIETKIPHLANSGPLFMECRNYFNFPNHQKGMLVGFKMQEDLEWNFGIIHKVFPDHLYMQVYVLKHGSNKVSESTVATGSKVYPAFYPLLWDELVAKPTTVHGGISKTNGLLAHKGSYIFTNTNVSGIEISSKEPMGVLKRKKQINIEKKYVNEDSDEYLPDQLSGAKIASTKHKVECLEVLYKGQAMELRSTMVMNEQGILVAGMAIWPPPVTFNTILQTSQPSVHLTKATSCNNKKQKMQSYNSTKIQTLSTIEWGSHFDIWTVNMYDFHTFRYLNQVNGQLPKIALSGLEFVQQTNTKDFCFEQSFGGPDVLRVPKDVDIEPLDPIIPINKFVSSSDNWKKLPQQFVSKHRLRRKRIDGVSVPPYFREPDHVVIDNLITNVVFIKDFKERNRKFPVPDICFHVPFLSDYLRNKSSIVYSQRFAMIPKKVLPEVYAMEGCQLKDFEVGLEGFSVKTYMLPCFNKGDEGLSFHLLKPCEYDLAVSSGQYEILKDVIDIPEDNVDMAFGSKHPEPIYELPGIRISTWIVDQLVHDGRISPQFVELCTACVGIGYGSRHCCASIGLNLYFGQRVSGLSNPTPVEGYNSASQCEYYRSSYLRIQMFPVLHNLWRQLRKKAFYLQEKMDYYYVKLLTSLRLEPSKNDMSEFHHRSPCRVGIITSGNKSHLGFANESHLDTGDILSKDEIDRIMSGLTHSYNAIIQAQDLLPSSTVERGRKVIDYASRIQDRIQMAVPTTCAYQHVLMDDNIQLIQFFIMLGLGSAVFIHDYISHNFYAHCFLHNTSVCVGIDKDDRVWLSNKQQQCGYMFAWGGSIPN